MDRNLDFKWTSYELFTFVDFLLICDFRPIKQQLSNNRTGIKRNQTAIERTRLQLTFFILNLRFIVLDLKVHHSNSIILTFCHGLPTLQTQNLTIIIIIIIITPMVILFTHL